MTATHIPCTLAEYHARPEWSHSQIEDLIASPALFYGRHICKPPLFPRKQSKELDIGTLVHQALLDPDGLDGILAVIPDEALNADGHRKGAAWKDWSAEHADRIQLKADEATPIVEMCRNAMEHPLADKLLKARGHVEHTLCWEHSPTGIPVRCRPDKIACLSGSRVALADIKTTRATTERAFIRDAIRFGYFRQAAWYWDGCEAAGMSVQAFYFIVIDKSPAHECVVYHCEPISIAIARNQNDRAMRDLESRLDSDGWNGRMHGKVIPMQLPAWAENEAPWEIENEHSDTDE